MKSTTRSQLREGDRPWGGRLWESHQAMNKNLMRSRQSGRSWHGPGAAQRVLESVTRYLSQKLRLIVNETKSKVVHLAEASFLGFRILRKKIRWTDKSQKKLKDQIRLLTRRTRGVSPQKVLADLESYLRGAINYYACGDATAEVD